MNTPHVTISIDAPTVGTYRVALPAESSTDEIAAAVRQAIGMLAIHFDECEVAEFYQAIIDELQTLVWEHGGL